MGYLAHSLRGKSYRLRKYASVSVSQQQPEAVSPELNNTILRCGHIRLGRGDIYRRQSWPRLSLCENLITLSFRSIEYSRLVMMDLPPTLTKLNGVIVENNHNNTRVDYNLLPCPSHIILSSFYSHSNIEDTLLSVQDDNTTVIELSVKAPSARAEDMDSYIDSAHSLGYTLSRHTLTSLDLQRLNEEWIPLINSLPNLIGLLAGRVNNVSSLYNLKAPLKTLRCYVAAHVLADKLPSTLTELTIGDKSGSTLYHCESLSHLTKLTTNMKIGDCLPSSLLHLHMDGASSLLLDRVDHCQHLAHLYYTPVIGDSHATWPDSITYLHIQAPVSSNFRVPDKLPRRLKTLFVKNATTQTLDMMKWSLAGLREVCVNYRLTSQQLSNFSGNKLNHDFR